MAKISLWNFLWDSLITTQPNLASFLVTLLRVARNIQKMGFALFCKPPGTMVEIYLKAFFQKRAWHTEAHHWEEELKICLQSRCSCCCGWYFRIVLNKVSFSADSAQHVQVVFMRPVWFAELRPPLLSVVLMQWPVENAFSFSRILVPTHIGLFSQSMNLITTILTLL